MKYLTLLRHAKSSWASADQDDFDRPLNKRGETNAPDMASRLVQKLAQKSCIPDLILCSSANRTQQTARFFHDAFKLTSNALQLHDELYLASAGTLLSTVQHIGDEVEHAMIIGHNPGLEILGRQLHPSAPAQLPTCAVLHFSMSNSSFVIEPSTEIELLFYDYPKNVT